MKEWSLRSLTPPSATLRVSERGVFFWKDCFKPKRAAAAYFVAAARFSLPDLFKGYRECRPVLWS